MQAYSDVLLGLISGPLGAALAIGKGPIGVFVFFTAFMVAAFLFFKKRGST